MGNATSLTLFVVFMDTVNYESEYGCMFVVAANTESAAETAVRDFYSVDLGTLGLPMPEHTMNTRRIGTADPDAVVGVVEFFTT
jgi:hypothetical protein